MVRVVEAGLDHHAHVGGLRGATSEQGKRRKQPGHRDKRQFHCIPLGGLLLRQPGLLDELAGHLALHLDE